MTYTLQHADSSLAPITVQPLTEDNTSTSLTFVGRGLPSYGQYQQTNFLQLLENFASYTSPNAPVVGQLWLDKNFTPPLLKVCTNNTNVDPISHAIVTTWEILSPLVNFAGSTPPPQLTGAQYTGSLWYDTSAPGLKAFDGTTWNLVSTYSQQSIGSTAPLSPIVGQLWFDTSAATAGVYTLKYYTGSANDPWVPVYYNDLRNQPAAPNPGDLWYDPIHNVLNYWQVSPLLPAGGRWVPLPFRDPSLDYLAIIFS